VATLAADVMRGLSHGREIKFATTVVSKAAEQIVTERLDCYLAVGSCGSGSMSG
jgi:hypothetical protein